MGVSIVHSPRICELCLTWPIQQVCRPGREILPDRLDRRRQHPQKLGIRSMVLLWGHQRQQRGFFGCRSELYGLHGTQHQQMSELGYGGYDRRNLMQPFTTYANLTQPIQPHNL